MKIKSGQEKQWKKYIKSNKDGYGKGIIDYAKRWAELMEVEIESGLIVAEMADRTSHEANTDGISGFMYGAAVATLADVWEYGDQLRIWHNAAWGIDEDTAQGRTVNPAIVTIK